MNHSTFIERLSHIYRRYERMLVSVYIIGIILFIAGFFGMLLLPGVMNKNNIPTRALAYWDNRWYRRVEYGERLVSSGQFSEAISYLSTLDRNFPFKHVKYKRDIERERLLHALGHSYAEMGKKRKSLITYRRLVEFDPRNFKNHYLLAMTCVRFKEFEEANEQFNQVLTIHPTHLPSLKEYVSIHFNRGDFKSVITAFEQYLNAFQLKNLKLMLGDLTVMIGVPVDGEFHDLEVTARQRQGWSGEMAIYTGGFSVEIEHVMLKAPLVIGRTGSTTSLVWPGKTLWQFEGLEPISISTYRTLGDNSVLRINLQEQPQGIDRVHIRIRLFKKSDVKLWDMVEKSYKNLLDKDGLMFAQRRMLTAGF